MPRFKGHTLIELVCVLVLVGILAAAFGFRLPEGSFVTTRALAWDIAAGLRHARKLAASSGCATGVHIVPAPPRVALLRWPEADDCRAPAGPGRYLTSMDGAKRSELGIDRELMFYFDHEGQPRGMDHRLILAPEQLQLHVGDMEIQIVPITGLVTGT